MENNLKFAATGVGSLPHANAKEALELILKAKDDIPYWPQLPKRSKFESMTVQYSEGFDFLEVDESAQIKLSEENLEKFYEKVLSGNLDNFAISANYAEGLAEFLKLLENNKVASNIVKGQVVGPFTLAASITDSDNRAIIHNPMLMDAVVNGLGLKAAWQKERFKKLGKKVIITFDEPYLGCFGSAFTPINQEEVVKRLIDLITPLKDDDTLVGVHCCGNTDWAMLLALSFDIINFDAYEFVERFLLYPKEIQSFLEKGGIIAWGLVPTADFPKGLKKEALIDKLENALGVLEKKGVSKDLVLNHSMLTPSCGMGTMQLDEAGEASKLLSELSFSLKTKH